MKVAGFFPHTSQSCSAFKGRSADVADEEAGADADAAAEEAGAEADTAAGEAGADDELVLGGGSADAAAEEAGAGADVAAAEAGADADADASGEEGRVGEVDNDGSVEVNGPAAALGGFSPFFFVMAWCVGVLEGR